jgi:hypothetical protein
MNCRDNYSMTRQERSANGFRVEVNGHHAVQKIKPADDCHWLVKSDRSTGAAGNSLAIDCRIQ